MSIFNAFSKKPTEYYIYIYDAWKGPFSIEVLKTLWQVKSVPPETSFCEAGSNVVKTLQEIESILNVPLIVIGGRHEKPAWKPQKKQLSFYGFKGFTKLNYTQAEHLITFFTSCFPDAVEKFENRPATEKQKKELAYLGKTVHEGLTEKQAEKILYRVNVHAVDAKAANEEYFKMSREKWLQDVKDVAEQFYVLNFTDYKDVYPNLTDEILADVVKDISNGPMVKVTRLLIWTKIKIRLGIS